MSSIPGGLPPLDPNISPKSTEAISKTTKSDLHITVEHPSVPLAGPPALTQELPPVTPPHVTANEIIKLKDEYSKMTRAVLKTIVAVLFIALTAALILNPITGVGTAVGVIAAVIICSGIGAGAVGMFGYLHYKNREEVEKKLGDLEGKVKTRIQELTTQSQADPSNLQLKHQLRQMNSVASLLELAKQSIGAQPDITIDKHNVLALKARDKQEEIQQLTRLQQLENLTVEEIRDIKHEAELSLHTTKGQLKRFDGEGIEKALQQLEDGEIFATDLDDNDFDNTYIRHQRLDNMAAKLGKGHALDFDDAELELMNSRRYQELYNKPSLTFSERIEKFQLGREISAQVERDHAITSGNIDKYQAVKRKINALEKQVAACESLLKDPPPVNADVGQRIATSIKQKTSELELIQHELEENILSKEAVDPDHLFSIYHSELNRILDDKAQIPASMIRDLKALDKSIADHRILDDRWLRLKSDINHAVHQLSHQHMASGEDRDSLVLSLSSIAQVGGLVHDVRITPLSKERAATSLTGSLTISPTSVKLEEEEKRDFFEKEIDSKVTSAGAQFDQKVAAAKPKSEGNKHVSRKELRNANFQKKREAVQASIPRRVLEIITPTAPEKGVGTTTEIAIPKAEIDTGLNKLDSLVKKHRVVDPEDHLPFLKQANAVVLKDIDAIAELVGKAIKANPEISANDKKHFETYLKAANDAKDIDKKLRRIDKGLELFSQASQINTSRLPVDESQREERLKQINEKITQGKPLSLDDIDFLKKAKAVTEKQYKLIDHLQYELTNLVDPFTMRRDAVLKRIREAKPLSAGDKRFYEDAIKAGKITGTP